MHKFEEALSTYDNKYYRIDEILKIFLKSPEKFENHYKDSFLCPECHQAPLSFKNAKHPFLSTYPNAKHSDDCVLRQNEMSKKTNS